jgi:SHS2 domain-containing protein
MEQVVLAMFAYMTDLTRVEIDPAHTTSFEVEGHDLDSLLFNLLDEFLFRFLTNEWVVRDVVVDTIQRKPGAFRVRVTGYGEHFTLDKHTQGTEVKAITYSNMQIFEHGKRVTSDNERAGQEAAAAAAAAAAARHDGGGGAGHAVSPPPEAHVIRREDDEGAADMKDSAAAAAADAQGQHAAEIYVIVDI